MTAQQVQRALHARLISQRQLERSAGVTSRSVRTAIDGGLLIPFEENGRTGKGTRRYFAPDAVTVVRQYKRNYGHKWLHMLEKFSKNGGSPAVVLPERLASAPKGPRKAQQRARKALPAMTREEGMLEVSRALSSVNEALGRIEGHLKALVKAWEI